MCSDLDFSCTLFKNFHTVGCRLSFQERAIPCQQLNIIQFRIAREMIWFILFLAQSCGRWRSARPLFQSKHESCLPLLYQGFHWAAASATALLHILSHPVWTWFSQFPSSVRNILQMVLNSISHQFGDIMYKARSYIPSYSYLDLE